jgi:hypothetical protein
MGVGRLRAAARLPTSGAGGVARRTARLIHELRPAPQRVRHLAGGEPALLEPGDDALRTAGQPGDPGAAPPPPVGRRRPKLLRPLTRHGPLAQPCRHRRTRGPAWPRRSRSPRSALTVRPARMSVRSPRAAGPRWRRGPKPSACPWSVSGVAEEQDLIGHPGGMDYQMPPDATLGEERVEGGHRVALRSRHARQIVGCHPRCAEYPFALVAEILPRCRCSSVKSRGRRRS